MYGQNGYGAMGGYGSMSGYGSMAGGMGGGDMGGYGGGRGAGAPGGGGRGPGQRFDSTFVEGKLFLGGLDNQTTRDTLQAYASQWGQTTDVVVMEGRGFGFVTFADPKQAQAFLEMRDHTIDGKRVEAKAAVPKTQGGSGQLTNKMFVGGTGDLTEDDLRNYFSAFGEIQDVGIAKNPEGRSRGFGFITYTHEMSVEKCLVQSHSIGGRRVDVKRAVPKGEAQPAARGGFGGGRGGGRTGGGYGGGMGGGAGGYGGMGGGYGMGGGMGGYGAMGGYGGYAAGGYGAGGYGAGVGMMGGYGAGGGFGRASGGGRGGNAMNRYRPY